MSEGSINANCIKQTLFYDLKITMGYNVLDSYSVLKSSFGIHRNAYHCGIVPDDFFL